MPAVLSTMTAWSLSLARWRDRRYRWASFIGNRGEAFSLWLFGNRILWLQLHIADAAGIMQA